MSLLESMILREIGAISRSIQTRTDVRFRDAGLQKGQFIFVTRICENPGINLVDLTQLLKVDKTTTTKAVKKLLEAGFIDRRKDSEDLRMWNLYPLKKALDLYPAIIAEENRNIDICYASLTEEEAAEVYRLIRKMRENLDAGAHNDYIKETDSDD